MSDWDDEQEQEIALTLEQIHKETISEKKEIEIKELTLDDIGFGGYTLGVWLEKLTVKMPQIPCSADTMNKAIAELNNRFQDSYNCFLELQVMHSNLKRTIIVMKEQKITSKIAEFQKAGVKKMPARDTLDTMISSDPVITSHGDELCKIELVKDFFEGHKDKLGKMMVLANSLSVNIGASDRMYNHAHKTNGL